MGTLDFGGLKLKLISSIVAISGIDLLKAFMNIGQISKEDLMWKVITHMAFVLSGVLLALMDFLTVRAKAASPRAEPGSRSVEVRAPAASASPAAGRRRAMISWPVMDGLAMMNSSAAAISSGLVPRCSGVARHSSSKRCRSMPGAASVGPGPIAFTRTRGASSRASTWVAAHRPIFEML